MDGPRSHTKPHANITTADVAYAHDISTSTIATTFANVTGSNITFAGNVSTASVADVGATSADVVAERLTVIGNYSFGSASTSSSSNASVIKNLTMKDSDSENSTELKSGALTNGTLVTLPPAVVPGHASGASSSSEENRTSAVGGHDDTLSAVMVDTRNVTFVGEVVNITGSDRSLVSSVSLDVAVATTTTTVAVETFDVDATTVPPRTVVASCPKSTYETAPGVCETCPLPCDECVGARNQSVHCVSCIVGRYLVAIDNVTSCTGLCPDSYYAGMQLLQLLTAFLRHRAEGCSSPEMKDIDSVQDFLLILCCR